MPESQLLVADLIVECLEREGVTHVFGIPGEENIHLVDALSRSSIRFILVRHEQGASFMAETYGRLTGRAGVCLATLGPGAINLLLGVADATTNSTPAHRSFRAGRNEPELQGVAPGRRPGLDVCSRHEMVGPRRHARGAAGDDQEGLQARPDRAARRRVPRRARRHRERGGTRRRSTPGGQRPSARRAVPEPGGPCRRHTQGGVESNRPGRPRRSPCRRRTGPDALRRVPRSLGGDDVPWQRRVPRRPSAGPGCDRVHAPRLRELRFRPGRRHRHGRLRAPGVRPGPDQSSR